jgi:hypothetical protein
MRTTFISILFLCLLAPLLSGQDQREPITGFASLVGMRNIVVTPVERAQTALLIDGGTIDTDGFTGLVINVIGQVEGAATNKGVIGAVLIPDVPPYDYAFKTLGLLPAIMEVTTPLETGQQYFMTKQARFDVGFPRYRVLFYNTSNTAVRLAIFGYRTR